MPLLRAPFPPPICCLVACFAGTATAQRQIVPPDVPAAASFAIVADLATWNALAAPIRAYRDAVQQDGLAAWILADDWQTPEAVRDALRELHRGSPRLEGALLVGAIPVVMVRGAQHLTTAFKMDEDRYPRPRSSVPSDRVYEDFDLVLLPLGQDEQKPLLHYRQFAPESPQRIDKEIYTARLFPPADGEAGLQALAACLQRFVREKQERPVLDRTLTLMGHGYVSESLTAWADGRAAVGELLPALRRPGGALLELHHERGEGLEAVLLRELADPALDLAILHSHGDDDREYLLGAPPLPGVEAQVEAVKRFVRGRLRKAREKNQPEASVQKELAERLQLPPQWFDKAFDPEVAAADAASDAKKELTADEVAAIACGARVLDLDACFNGNFLARPWQAGAYLYGQGRTVAVVANSVNVAQDVWGDRHLGALARGERVGAWHRARVHLESHLFGDPTFRFAWGASEVADRQRALASWLALPDGEARLLAVLREDPASAVRFEALALLAGRRGDGLFRALPIAIADPAEMVRRAAACLMGDFDRPEFVAPLLRALLRDPSERVTYRAREALCKYGPEVVALAFGPAVDALPVPLADPAAALRGAQTAAFLGDYRTEARDRSLPVEKRVTALRTFRLYRVHAVVPELLALAQAADDEAAVRTAAMEALGWYGYSSQRDGIAAAADALAADPGVPEAVRAEARKTARRLRDGANDPLLP
ncbi:MAG: hypothetical protein FJ265_09770 [Planctomycetes bacterium]|nr:hypothetical protein [Planctomycetota bacterium]